MSESPVLLFSSSASPAINSCIGIGIGMSWSRWGGVVGLASAAVWLETRRRDRPLGSPLVAQEARVTPAVPPPHLNPHGMIFPPSQWDANWDGREPSEDPRPVASRHLLLIRHGQYELTGATDEARQLTDLGREQAEATGRRLAQLQLPLTEVIQSSMTRAMETAGLIVRHLPESVTLGRPDDILREGGPIRPEPSSRWSKQQTYHVDGARIEAGFRKYFHRAQPDQTQDSYQLMVCHANVIRYFVCRSLQLPPEAWLRISLMNGSITWVTIRPDGRVSVCAVGDGGHFPVELRTTT
eukprot:snap_masked-scaffold261_size233860-processed-gene-1.9 protein:Tk10681 transcript:snap_masked-scaffold261_size233860-processed-gene-1.9-mRNA-1 annotation:"serine threonine-protein phosphatase mitochondrial-like isoform x2"